MPTNPLIERRVIDGENMVVLSEEMYDGLCEALDAYKAELEKWEGKKND